jgi:hypothetical protein
VATASLRQILDELAAQLVAFYEDSDPPMQIEPRYVGRPSPPTIDIFPGDVVRDDQSAAFGDISGGFFITVRARVQTSDNEANQDILVAFLDDEDDLCLAHAVLDEPTLNGYAASMSLQGVTGFLLDPTGLIGVQWTFLVIPGAS